MKPSSLILSGIVFFCGAEAFAQSETTSAQAKISPTAGNAVSGKVTFREEQGSVRVDVDLTGLSPGKHGFHIHEKGDCSAPDATSAGEHFNPSAAPHAAPTSPERHAGDLGNLVADKDGKVKTTILDPALKLSGPTSILERSVIVHEKEDDFATQPTGNSGGRQGCGVIQPLKS